MTGIELFLVTLTFFYVGGYVQGTDKQLEVPYTTFQNSYLQFKIVANGFETELTKKKPIPISFTLGQPIERPYELFGGFKRTYDLAYDPNWLDLYYDKQDSIPQEIIKHPTKYFVKKCDYQVPMPVGKFTLFMQSNLSLMDSLLLYYYKMQIVTQPDQTLYIRLMYDNNFKLSTIKIDSIPTPPDIEEIKKCFVEK